MTTLAIPDSPSTGPLSPDMGERLKRLADLGTPQLAPLSERTYLTKANAYATWCTVHGLPPEAVQSALLYLVEMQGEGKRKSTINVASHAIRWRFPSIKKQLRADEHADETWRNVLRNSRRLDQRQPKQAKPLRQREFVKILACGYVRPWKKALISVMRDGLLRSAELVLVRYCDISPYEDGSGASLFVSSSKTDQEGLGAVLFVSALTLRLLADAGIDTGRDDADFIFGFGTRFVRRSIAEAAFNAKLPGSFDPVRGVPANGYSGHSPRVGMVHDLLDAGFGLTDLQVVGRWASPRMLALYARGRLASDNAVAKWYAQQAVTT